MLSNKLIGVVYFFFILIFWFGNYSIQAGSIINSTHDFSTSEQNNGEVCIYCHTPHNANGSTTVLWNRDLKDPSVYTLYNSSTLEEQPVGPGSVSLLCLCCHDGIISTENILPDFSFHGKSPECTNCHSMLDPAAAPFTDLSDDHPVSIPYSLVSPGLHERPINDVFPNGVRLFEGRVECASCHNVHDPDNRPFLRIADSGSALCYTCHIK